MNAKQKKLNILLICKCPDYGGMANTVGDHIKAFKKYSMHNVFVLNNYNFIPERLNLNAFDVVVVHYSVSLLLYALSKATKVKLQQFCGLKVVFVQDEYRRVNQMHNELNFIKADVLYTCVPEEEIETVYPKQKLPNLKKIQTLTGFIPENLLDKKFSSINERKMDVVYRARKLPFWYGSLAVEKWEIVDKFIEHTKEEDLSLDLSYREKDRIYGDAWIDFLSSAKTTLGVESGASVFDFTGEIEGKVELFQLKHAKASYQEVHNKFLSKYDMKIKLNQISPRCFEAIACKTAMILYEGDYSGILVPWRHYIPLKKNMSNIKEVVTAIKDDKKLETIANQAYQEIALNKKYMYCNFIESVDLIMNIECLGREILESALTYSDTQFQCLVSKLTLKDKKKYVRHALLRFIHRHLMQLYQVLPTWFQYKIKEKILPSLSAFIHAVVRA